MLRFLASRLGAVCRIIMALRGIEWLQFELLNKGKSRTLRKNLLRSVTCLAPSVPTVFTLPITSPDVPLGGVLREVFGDAHAIVLTLIRRGIKRRAVPAVMSAARSTTVRSAASGLSPAEDAGCTWRPRFAEWIVLPAAVW